MSTDEGTQTPPPTDLGGLDKLLIGVEDKEARAGIEKIWKQNEEMLKQSTETQKWIEEQRKKEEGLKLKEYNIEKNEVLKELAILAPDQLEENKETHLDELKIVVKTLKKVKPELQVLGNPAKPDKPEDEINYSWDIVNKKQVP